MTTTVTRTISLIRSGKMGASIREWFGVKVDRAVTRVFIWALKNPAVREVVIAAIASDVAEIADERADAAIRSISADDIDGLENMIETEVERETDEISAAAVKAAEEAVEEFLDRNLKDAVEEVFGDVFDKETLTDEVEEEVRKAIVERLS